MASPWRIGLTAALVLGGGTLATATLAQRDDDPEPAAPQPAAAVIPPPSPGVLTNSPATASGPTAPGEIGVATAPITLRYTFDGGVGKPITDDAGGHELRPLGQNGGALTLVPQSGGLALAYPARCTLPTEESCPRAILEGVRDDNLNPGNRPISYGASVLMTEADLADGANVVQKGFSVGRISQFKLQVDHLQGRPSCVITGAESKIYRAEAKLNVADGSWHDLACARTGNRLTLTVDGVERAAVQVPRTVAVANAEPLRVGGKSVNKNNDQFAGQIDNVFLSIS